MGVQEPGVGPTPAQPVLPGEDVRQSLRQYLTDWSLQSLDYTELSTRILSYMSSECPPFRLVPCGRRSVGWSREEVGAELCPESRDQVQRAWSVGKSRPRAWPGKPGVSGMPSHRQFAHTPLVPMQTSDTPLHADLHSSQDLRP